MQSAAHDSRLEIAGELYFVRRPFELMKAIEQRFGALAELERRLRGFNLTGEELIELAHIALRFARQKPPVEDVRQHLMDAGVKAFSEALVIIVIQLFAGHEAASKWLAEEAAKGHDKALAEGLPPDPRQAAA